ncbi:3-oxoacyl-reductase [Coniochaeta sp. 2T2.1]|nr:3-oxoacyl-reductase [Coniochaeta sp. 2T2.1]
MGGARNAAYSASKHAVIGLTRSAAKELGERQIRCNCFCPGLIDTPMVASLLRFVVQSSMLVIRRLRRQQPSDIASLVVFLLGEGSKFMTGDVINIDGGWMC